MDILLRKGSKAFSDLGKNFSVIEHAEYQTYWTSKSSDFVKAMYLRQLEKSNFLNEKPFFIVIREQNSSEHWKKKTKETNKILETSMGSILDLVGFLTSLLKSLVIPTILLALTGAIYSNLIICSN